MLHGLITAAPSLNCWGFSFSQFAILRLEGRSRMDDQRTDREGGWIRRNRKMLIWLLFICLVWTLMDLLAVLNAKWQSGN